MWNLDDFIVILRHKYESFITGVAKWLPFYAKYKRKLFSVAKLECFSCMVVVILKLSATDNDVNIDNEPYYYHEVFEFLCLCNYMTN